MNDEKYRILIDCDPGLGKKGADVDDGLALFIILNNPERFQVEGITTVFGNTRLTKGFRLLEEYLDMKGAMNIPHHKGAKSAADLGVSTEASNFLVDMVKKNPGEIILISLGPLTNIATALHTYPEFLNNVKEYVFMGGVINPVDAFSKKFTFGDELFVKNEFNFNQDPQATKTVIEAQSQTPRVGFGLDICCQAVFKKEHLDRIKNAKNPLTEYILEDLEYWLNLWEHNKSKGFFPFDTFVPLYLMNRELFSFNNYYLRVDTEQVPGMLIKTQKESGLYYPVNFCMGFSTDSGPEIFMEKLLSNLLK
ncbi:MAG: putative Inosine/uridine-preferring nucleoside hydrolase [Promethearchaeota archaeon]|jgi:inosine-uridine nucleoside N-ribohydrolase|nr:MAG: putative Inosine/uridine-preferring nucleoside hydrolase [Candidatus Lokiarchaeota archaeon]